MESFLQRSPRERAEAFQRGAQRMGFSAEVMEKDFWVCWTLKELFGLPEVGERLIFKGGTSLSKAYRIIERFSEDIDVSIDRGFLGFGGPNEPEAGGSNKERQRRVEALKGACQAMVATRLQPELATAIRSRLPLSEAWALCIDDEDPDRQTLLFEYPSSFPNAAEGYIRRRVKIEMGARADHWPCESRTITSYVAELFPRAFEQGGCAVKVLAAERTFWEKATILHAEFHRPFDKPTPERFSRHYCDFHELIRKGVGESAVGKLDLLARVAEHKGLFFRSSWARYGEAIQGTLRVAPPEYRVKALHEDHRRMEQMFFGIPPKWDEVVRALR